jgi:chitin-binding protein
MFIASTSISVIIAKMVADAHGYVTIGRANKCRVGLALNTKCGNVMYDNPGVESFKGFPSALGPADGKIASDGYMPPAVAPTSPNSTSIPPPDGKRRR